MKLSKIKVSTKHIQVKDDGSIPLSTVAPYDFEDGDTNNFKDFKATPKKPYSHEQVLKAMFALHRMIERQANNYSKGKLFKAGVVSEGETEDNHNSIIQECYDLLHHLHEAKDETGLQLFMGIVSGIIDLSDVEEEPSESAGVREDQDVVPDADAYGGVLIHGNKVLLREPTNHFGGYVWTFAKGRVDAGEDPQTVALREVYEETGYHAKITHLLPTVYGGSTSTTVFFIMEIVGEPDAFGWETQSIKWASYDEAVELINQTKISSGRNRDLQILQDAFHGDRVAISTLTESKKKN